MPRLPLRMVHKAVELWYIFKVTPQLYYMVLPLYSSQKLP